jgi:hypothetical protein|tara:strand:+ start:125 stop:541 length:417 start_codon:yes stop_codon:yes gene_type:complete
MISEQNISTTVPPKVYAVMVKYSQGIKMKQACEEVGIDPRTVKKWETTPEVKKFYSSLIKDAFVEGKNKLFKAWPKVAERLIKTATDPRERSGSRNQASEIIVRYIIHSEQNMEMREKLEKMSQQIAALEGNRIIDME